MCRDEGAVLPDLSIAELRAERADLRRTESRMSYERRLLQGRIDIVRAELLSRSEGAGDTAMNLADRLAVVLTDRDEHHGDPMTVTTLRVDVPEGSEGLFDDQPSDLTVLSIEDLEALALDLEAHEVVLSAQRREIFAAIDRLASELADRYRSGDVPVAQLLDG